MRITATMLVALAMAIAPSSALAYTFDDVEVTYWTGAEPGDGVSEALLVVDWQAPGQDSVVFGYRWTGAATGEDMLGAIDPDGSRFYFEWHVDHEGAVYGIGWDADDDGFDKTDPGDHYEEGWSGNTEGFWRYYLSGDGEDWAVSEDGVAGRDLSDGDWDGWSWSQDFVSSDPNDLPLAGGAVTPGDSNGDGVVDSADYDNMIAQFGGAPGADSADFNGDSVVDLADFAIMRGNFGIGVGSAPGAGSAASTPEPATMTFLALGGSVLTACRRRRCCSDRR